MKGSIIRNGIEMPYALIPQHLHAKYYLAELDAQCQAANIPPASMGDRITITDDNGKQEYYNQWGINDSRTYTIDTLPANNLPLQEERAIISQRMGDIARNNRKFSHKSVGSTIRTLLIARKKNSVALPKAIGYGIMGDALACEDYGLWFSKAANRMFDYWYFQPVVTA